MKVMITLLLLSAIVVTGGCASGGGSFLAGYDFTRVKQVAVVEVTGYFKNEGVRNQISTFVEMELLERGFAPVERTRVQAILDEQDFQTSDLTSKNGVAKVGEILNVPAILLIDIPEFGEDINITAKMIDTTDASILWAGFGKGRTGKLLTTVVAATAGAIAGAAVDSDHKTEGAVIGGVLGGAAGYTLSPQAAEKVKEVIGKMCDSMPSRL